MQVPPWPQSITWYNSEGKIDEEAASGRYKQIVDGLGGYALEVKPTEACDQGEWKCVAKSEQGTIAITTCDIKMISKCSIFFIEPFELYYVYSTKTFP